MSWARRCSRSGCATTSCSSSPINPASRPSARSASMRASVAARSRLGQPPDLDLRELCVRDIGQRRTAPERSVPRRATRAPGRRHPAHRLMTHVSPMSRNGRCRSRPVDRQHVPGAAPLDHAGRGQPVPQRRHVTLQRVDASRRSSRPDRVDQMVVGHDLTASKRQCDEEDLQTWPRQRHRLAVVVPHFERSQKTDLHPVTVRPVRRCRRARYRRESPTPRGRLHPEHNGDALTNERRRRWRGGARHRARR